MPSYQGLQYGDSLTLAGIREAVYYEGKVSGSFINANDLNRIINKYYFKVQEVIRAVNENFYLQQATADLQLGSVNDASYTFPDGVVGTAPAYEKVKAIYAAYNPANIAAPLASEFEKANIVDAQQISDPSYTFTKLTALIYGTYFVLLPLPTGSNYPVIDGVKMYYIAEQAPLVNDTDRPKIFPSFHDAIVTGSLIDIFRRKGDKVSRDESLREFNQRLEEVKAYASNHLPPEIGVIEGQETQGGWEYPWFNSSGY